MRTEERDVRMGAEATEVEASGRKNTWREEELSPVPWAGRAGGQAGQVGRRAGGEGGQAGKVGRRAGGAGRESRAEEKAGEKQEGKGSGGCGSPEAELCGEGRSAGHLREAGDHEDRKDAPHSGSQMPFAKVWSVQGWAEARCLSVRPGHGERSSIGERRHLVKRRGVGGQGGRVASREGKVMSV